VGGGGVLMCSRWGGEGVRGGRGGGAGVRAGRRRRGGRKGRARPEVEGGADRWAPPVGDRVREREGREAERAGLGQNLRWAGG
jgi:hypothetical protein